jgi:hypothetical protein
LDKAQKNQGEEYRHAEGLGPFPRPDRKTIIFCKPTGGATRGIEGCQAVPHDKGPGRH